MNKSVVLTREALQASGVAAASHSPSKGEGVVCGPP